jgi:hypothetical protein
MCSLQFSLQSNCSPRYFTDSTCGSTVWLVLIAGQMSFLRVKVMCDDLFSFTFIFHFFSQLSTVLKCSWRLREDVVRIYMSRKYSCVIRESALRCVPRCRHGLRSAHVLYYYGRGVRGVALERLLEKTNENQRKRTIQSEFVPSSWLKARLW